MRKISSNLKGAFITLLLLLAALVLTAAAQTPQELAQKGYAIATVDRVLAQVRLDGLTNGSATDGYYLTGFDIATAIFGDPALGAQGNTAVGPGALKYRNALTASGQKGFDDSVKFHLNRHYKRNAGEVYATDKKSTANGITMITAPGNTADITNEVRCEGGASRENITIGFETLGSRQTSTGETINTILLTAEPGPYGAGLKGEGLRPAQCAWVDRPVDVLNGSEIYFLLRFETPANAQLSQQRHGTPLDTSPTAAERFPDAQTIPEYLRDPDHYWSFFGVRKVGNYYVATGHKYWRLERPAVKAVGRTKTDAPTGPKRPICDVAREARARNTPAAAGLEESCRAELAAKGAAIAQADRVVAEARAAETDPLYRQGFDIATGIFGNPALGANGNTSTGPGSLGIRDSLSAARARRFHASVKLHL